MSIVSARPTGEPRWLRWLLITLALLFLGLNLALPLAAVFVEGLRKGLAAYAAAITAPDALSALKLTLTVAAIATVLALSIGLLAGLVAGSGPPLLDEALMRGAEITASLPALLLAVLVAALFGGSAWNLALLLGLTRWPVVARIVRMEVRSLLGREFLRAAWALGASPVHVARRHLLPHLANPVLAAAGIVFGGAVVAEAALTFVGLGDPTVTSWGQMVAAGFAVLGLGWWVWLWPAAMLVMISGLVAVAAESSEEGH